ncbi:hypothetical protein B1729_03145 [Microbacterium sp. B35-04]|nr:hypothetical protein B1729_03145 [Microbacterium sp. B35-04]
MVGEAGLRRLAIVDIRDGATLTLPDAGERYMSVMVVNEDHYINRVFHSGGTYELTTSEFDTPWVLVASRILVDPADRADVAAVNTLQDGLKIDTSSTEEFTMPEYDKDSFEPRSSGAGLPLARTPGRGVVGRRGGADGRQRGDMGRFELDQAQHGRWVGSDVGFWTIRPCTQVIQLTRDVVCCDVSCSLPSALKLVGLAPGRPPRGGVHALTIRAGATWR